MILVIVETLMVLTSIQVKLKEAIIIDTDISRGILDYAKRNHIQTIIVGAPTGYKKNVLSRSLNMRTISKLSFETLHP